MPLQAESRLIDARAERIVLAGLMRAPDLNMSTVETMLRMSDFAFVHHGWLFSKCVELWTKYRMVPLRLDWIARDIVNLRGAVCDRRDFGLSPWAELARIYNADPTGAHCVWKAEKVRQLAERRMVIHEANVRIRDAMDGIFDHGNRTATSRQH